MKPKIAMKNLFSDIEMLRRFALENGFEGIDWSFKIDELPLKPASESRWVERLAVLYPLEVRYHCPFMKVDIGHDDCLLAPGAGSAHPPVEADAQTA